MTPEEDARFEEIISKADTVDHIRWDLDAFNSVIFASPAQIMEEIERHIQMWIDYFTIPMMYSVMPAMCRVKIKRLELSYYQKAGYYLPSEKAVELWNEKNRLLEIRMNEALK